MVILIVFSYLVEPAASSHSFAIMLIMFSFIY